MTTTYNYLFNGNNLLDQGKKEFNNTRETKKLLSNFSHF
jgi:hypothetical protein